MRAIYIILIVSFILGLIGTIFILNSGDDPASIFNAAYSPLTESVATLDLFADIIPGQTQTGLGTISITNTNRQLILIKHQGLEKYLIKDKSWAIDDTNIYINLTINGTRYDWMIDAVANPTLTKCQKAESIIQEDYPTFDCSISSHRDLLLNKMSNFTVNGFKVVKQGINKGYVNITGNKVEIILPLTEIDHLNRIELGESSTVYEYQELNLIEYELDWANVNWSLSCNNTPESDIWIRYGNKFGADGNFSDVRECKYEAVSTLPIHDNNYKPYVSRRLIDSSSNIPRHFDEIHSFNLNDICSKTNISETGIDSDCELEYWTEVIDSYFDEEFNQTVYVYDYHLNVTFNSNNDIDPEITYSEFTDSNSILTNITAENNFTHLTISELAPYDSLVLYMPFDVPVVPRWAHGQINNSLVFEGDDDYIKVPQTTSLNFTGLSTITVSTWVNFNELINIDTIIMLEDLDEGDGSEPVRLFIRDSGGFKFAFAVLNNSIDSIEANSITSLSTGVWTHLVGTYNGSDVKVYYNGIEENSSVHTGIINPPNQSNASWNFGAGELIVQSRFFNGSMDEVMIFNRSLSASEISELYNNQSSKLRAFTEDVDLVGSWYLDEIGGKKANDAKGGNDGILNGFVDDTVYDWSKFNNDGTTVGHAGYTSEGLYDGAMFFDGLNDSIDIVPVATATPIVISAWFNLQDVNGAQIITCIGGNNATSISEYCLLVVNGAIWALTQNDIGGNVQSTKTGVSANTWYYGTAVFGSNASRLVYLDGIAGVEETTDMQVHISNIQRTRIGKRANDQDPQYFNGSIDEVMIFNTSLTAQQILDIYNNQSSRFKVNGTQELKQFNMSLAHNWLQVIEEDQQYMGSDLQKRLGTWNVSKRYKDWDFDANTYGVFDGDGDYVDAGNLTDDWAGSAYKPFSVTFWAKRNSVDFAGVYNLNVNNHQLFVYDDGDLAYGNSQLDDSTWERLDCNCWNDTTKFHYIAVRSHTDTNVEFFVDGVSQGNVTSSFVLNFPFDEISIGAYSLNSLPNSFDGAIDEFKIYSQALTTERILEENASGRVVNSSLDTTGILGYWDFNEDGYINDGKLVQGKSLTNNSGTIVGDVSYSGLNSGSPSLNSSLKLYYHFDNLSAWGETDNFIFDFSRNWMNGTFTKNGTGAMTDTGVYDGGIFFDGDGDYVTTPSGSLLDINVSQNGLTISTWVNSRDVSGGASFGDTNPRYIIVQDQNDVADVGYGIRVLGQNVNFLYRNLEDTAYVDQRTDNNPISVNIWYHVVVVHNTTDIIIYIDGSEGSSVLTTGSASSNNMQNSEGVIIGSQGGVSSPTRYWNGTIDEVMIFNRSLSPEQVKELYIKGRAKFLYSDYQDADSEYFTFEYNMTNFLLDYRFNAGNNTNPFYSPILKTSSALPLNVTDLGSELGGCANLAEEGTTYTLQNNVSSPGTCFRVVAPNITIDCNGYEINYSYGGIVGYGVTSDQVNTTVKNCDIKEGVTTTNNKHAVYFNGADNGTIVNNTITIIGTSYGVYGFSGANNNNIINNSVTTSGTSGLGMVLSTSLSNAFDNNNITTSGSSSYGLYITDDSYDNVFSNMNITTTHATASYGVYMNVDKLNNTIVDSIITATSSSDIYVDTDIDPGSYLKLINVTFNQSDVQILDSDFDLIVQQYYRTYVNDSSSNIVPDAFVYSDSMVENTTGLVGWWKMNNDSIHGENDSDVTDFSGFGNNGTVTNALVNSSGLIRGGYSFDGDGDYVDLGASSELEGVESISLSLWFRANELEDWAGIITDSNANDNRFGIDLSGSGLGGNNDFIIMMGNGSNAYGYTNENLIGVDVWYHGLMVFNGSGATDSDKLKFYLNGQEKTLNYVGVIASTTPTSGNLYLGRDVFVGTYFNGSIDEVMTFNRSLTASEIKELYYKGVYAVDDVTNASGYISQTNITDYIEVNTSGVQEKIFFLPNITANNVSDEEMVIYNVSAFGNNFEHNIEINLTGAGPPVDAPPVSILSRPADNNVTPQGVVELECNATDAFDVSNITIEIYNQTNNSIIYTTINATSGTSVSTVFAYNFTTEDLYLWNCLASDNNSQTDWATNRTLNITTPGDVTPPTFTNIANFSEYNNITFNYQINATDETSFDCFSLNDTTNFNISCTGFINNVTDVAVGEYVLNVTINDSSNNLATDIMNITIDEYDYFNPYFTDIANFTEYNNVTFYRELNATDDESGLDCFALNDTSNFNISCSGVINNVTDPTFGIYYLNVTINDSVNNINSSIFYINWSNSTFPVPDSTPPYFTNEANQTLADNLSLSYTMTATDDGVGLGTWWINWTTQFSMNAATGELTNSSTLLNQLGEHYINVTVNDTLGNMNSTILMINVTNSSIEDTGPPTLTLVNFTQQANQSFTGAINATDPGGIGTYSLNETGNFTVNEDTGVITNITALDLVWIYWLNISVNDTYGKLSSGIFYINITEQQVVAASCGAISDTVVEKAEGASPYVQLCYSITFKFLSAIFSQLNFIPLNQI